MTQSLKTVVVAGLVSMCLSLPCGLAASDDYEIQRVTPRGLTIMSESPYWDDETKTVIFVDVTGKKVLRYDPADGDVKYVSFERQQGRVTPAVPLLSSNQILVGLGRTLHIVEVSWGEVGAPSTVTWIKALHEVEENMRENRFNDGKADHQGRMWIGTMDDNQTSRQHNNFNKGELYRFNVHQQAPRNFSAETTCQVEDDLQIPNGMAWTSNNDGFYLADSDTRAIYYFDYDDEAGLVANRKTVFLFAANDVPGSPDGLTMDVDGNLWIACVHGGRVIQVDPRTGKLLKTIKMEVTNVSAAEWGGVNRDVLYVTSSRYQMNALQLAKEPNAGCMFAITKLGTRGVSGRPFPAKILTAAASSSSTSPTSSTTTKPHGGSWGLGPSWVAPVLALLLSTFNMLL